MHRIDGALGLPEVHDLILAWRDRLAEGDLIIDLTTLTDIDAAGLQALLSAKAEAALRGRAVTLRMPQAGPIPAMLVRLGLDPAWIVAGQAQRPEQETA